MPAGPPYRVPMGDTARRVHPVAALLLAITALALTAGAAMAAVLRATPVPSARVIRHAFDRGSRATSALLEPLVPPGVTSVLDVVVDGSDPDARLDVFHPSRLDGTAETLPTVVWVHGGGWVSGDKRDVSAYARILASHGWTVVSVGYSIAPEHTYPVPVRQVAAAVRHVVAHAAELHVDSGRTALAGDSAGSQIAAQVAALVADGAYAAQVGVEPPLRRDQLRAAVLFCGAYDLARVGGSGLRGWFLRTVMWSYAGTRHFATDPGVALASIRDHVTGAFPPTFVSAGNADPLLPHSIDLADRLTGLGVPVDTLFFAADHEPALGHEYQFRLDLPEGRLALERVLAFLGSHLRGGAD